MSQNDMRKLIEMVEGSTDIQYPDYDDKEDEIKEAFLAGYRSGFEEGDRQASGTGSFTHEETPEEAYEYWVKYDKDDGQPYKRDNS